MADSAVAVTAGSGTSIDTRTESTNGNHRQVIVLGDPSSNTGVAPVDATAGLKVDLGADNDVNITQINGVNITTGNGTSGTGVQRVSLASDSTGNIATIGTSITPGTSSTHLGKARDGVAGSTDTGLAMLAVRRDSPTAVTPAAGDYEVPQMNATGSLYTATVPTTSGGLTISRTISAASTNATSVKASAGQVYTIVAVNTNAAVRYLKLYNKASSPTVGTDTPVVTLPIPASTTGSGFVLDTGGMGITFGTGIAYAITTGVADTDTGVVAANEIVVNVFYK